jgi:hypothetical protein
MHGMRYNGEVLDDLNAQHDFAIPKDQSVRRLFKKGETQHITIKAKCSVGLCGRQKDIGRRCKVM